MEVTDSSRFAAQPRQAEPPERREAPPPHGQRSTGSSARQAPPPCVASSAAPPPPPAFICREFSATDSSLSSSLSSYSCLVGLHPDEVTADIVLAASRLRLPFAVVPCCVFPSLFPARRRHSPSGALPPVNAHQHLALSPSLPATRPPYHLHSEPQADGEGERDSATAADSSSAAASSRSSSSSSSRLLDPPLPDASQCVTHCECGLPLSRSDGVQAGKGASEGGGNGDGNGNLPSHQHTSAGDGAGAGAGVGAGACAGTRGVGRCLPVQSHSDLVAYLAAMCASLGGRPETAWLNFRGRNQVLYCKAYS